MSHTAASMPVEVFCSYAHKDEAIVREVLSSFDLPVQSGLLSIWQDRQIYAGREWVKEIDLHLNTAQIILLFVSTAFLASRYCTQVELPRALERSHRREAQVIPIVLERIDLSTTSFGHLQALPPNGKPLCEWSDQREAARTIALHLEALAHRLVEAGMSMPLQRARLLNLPTLRNPYFTGQQEVLEQLHRSLHQMSALVQALTGLGGIGKTQTAVEYAYRYQGEYDTILWVNAESMETLSAGYGRLAHLLMLPERDEQEQSRVNEAVIRWMETHEQWLLVLDNVEDLDIMRSLLPQTGNGHLLLTTRNQVVGELASPVLIEAMGRETGALFLLRRAKLIALSLPLYAPSLASHLREEALLLSEELGGLPLALDQAGAYIEATDCGVAGYRERYALNRTQYLAERGSSETTYPLSVALTWSLSFGRVEQSNAVAADLLRVCAFLAPDAIPESMLARGATHLGPTLGLLETNPFLLDEALRVLRMYSLVRRDATSRTKNLLSVHRLVQAVLRDQMSKEADKVWKQRAVLIVDAASPDAQDVKQWDACENWLPHALVCATWIEQEQMQLLEAARLLNVAGCYLDDRARYGKAEPLLERSLAIIEQQLGTDLPDTAQSLNNLAGLYRDQGKYEEAGPLYERALAIRERQLGAEHPDTTRSLNYLAELYRVQGKYGEAEPLLERALAICEQHLGDEHPYTALSLNNLASLYESQGKYEEAEPLYVRSLAIWERQMGAEHPDTALSLNNLAELYCMQGKYGEAEPLLERALAICEQHLGDEHPDTVLSLNNLAGLYERQGKYREAEPLLERALAICEQYLGDKHSSTALSLNSLADLYQVQGKYKEAEPLYARALAIGERLLGTEHPSIALTLNAMALLRENEGRYEEAEPLLERSLAIIERQLGGEHPDTALGLNNLAELYRVQGRYGEAEPLYVRALAICEQHLGDEHPDMALGLNNLAELYQVQGRYGEAEPLLERALAIWERQLGGEHPNTALSLNNLAELYRLQGRYGEAEPLYVRALAICERQLGGEHPDTARGLNNLAELYRVQGRYKEAEPLHVRALAIWRHLGGEHPNTALGLNNLAELYRVQGKYKQAEPLYVQALAIRERQLGDEHPDTALSLNNLAGLYQVQGKYKQAELLFQRALAIREQQLGPDHPDTASSRWWLASLAHEQGKHARAKVLYEQALLVFEKQLGADHPNTHALREQYKELLRDI